MKDDKIFKHRLKSILLDCIEKGYNSFFYYGVGIGDVFLYDYPHGILSISETFKHIFLDKNTDNTSLVDIFIYAKGESVLECWHKSNNEYENITTQFFAVEQEEDDSEGIHPSSHITGRTRNAQQANSQDNNNTQIQNIQNNLDYSNQLNKNNWNMLIDKINTSQRKVGIFIENIQWLANLYASNKDTGLIYIKIIQELIKNKLVYLAFSVPNIDLLKAYDFDFESKNTIFVGNPTVQEIKIAYLRYFLMSSELTEITIDILDELDKISAGIVASKKNLRAAIRILKGIINNNSHYEIKYDDFENAFEKNVSEDISIDDVILEERIKTSILTAVDTFLSSNTSNEKPKKGLIFSVPSGTGKTLIAKAIAREKDCYFMAPSLSDLKGEYVGQTSGKVRRIFDEARASQPTILFIDEADTIFPSRDLAGIYSDSYNLDMVNQFLVEIDGAKSDEQKIFVIAATNRVEILDDAIKSRLGKKPIAFPLPNKEQRKDIFELKLKKDKITFKDKAFAEIISEKTENMSGRDIDNFVKTLREKARNEYQIELASLNEAQLEDIFFETIKNEELALIESLKDKQIGIEVVPPAPNGKKRGLNSIIGYENIKDKIRARINYLKATYEEKSTRVAEPWQGMLLYGPPGNAKSVLAQAAAQEGNLYFVKVLSKDFASINPEVTLNNLRNIFSEVVKLAKMLTDIDGVLLFFDEYDSLASSSQLDVSVRGTLLDYIADNEKKGLRDPNGKILFMAATNFKDDLDEALIRKGRMDEHCSMNNPPTADAKKMLKFFFKKKNVDVTDSLIDNIYESMQEQKRKEYLHKLENNPLEFAKLQNKQAVRAFYSELKQLEMQSFDISPSGADLENIAEDVIRTAENLRQSASEPIVITEDAIRETFKEA